MGGFRDADGNFFPELKQLKELVDEVLNWGKISYEDGSLTKWGLVAAAVLFLVAFLELWEIPRKGMRRGDRCKETIAGNSQYFCDGTDVECLGATVYLSRQMLIWSNSRIARVGALVVDSSVAYGGTVALSVLWGLTAAVWVYVVVKLGVNSVPGDVSSSQPLTSQNENFVRSWLRSVYEHTTGNTNGVCVIHDDTCYVGYVYVDIVFEYVGSGLNSAYEYATGRTNDGGVSPAAYSSFTAGVSGFITGMISFPDIVVVFTPAATGYEVFSSLVGVFVYVCASCIIGALAGAPVGLLAVTSVVFPVFVIGLVWGNFALRFVPADDYASTRFLPADQWKALFDKVLARGIGQKVLGISDAALMRGLQLVEANRVAPETDADRVLETKAAKELRSLVASLVRSDRTRMEYGLVEELTLRRAVELMWNTTIAQDPTGLRRKGHDIIPTINGRDLHMGGVTCRLVKVTNSTSPTAGRDGRVKHVFYEEDEIQDGQPPPLSLVAVQSFRSPRCRIQVETGPGYCQSVGPPPLTVEEGLLIVFVLLLICWLVMDSPGKGGDAPVWTVATVFSLVMAVAQRHEYTAFYRAVPGQVVQKIMKAKKSRVMAVWLAIALTLFMLIGSDPYNLYLLISVYIVLLVGIRALEFRWWVDDECWRIGVMRSA